MSSLDGMRQLRVDDLDSVASAAAAAGLLPVHTGGRAGTHIDQTPNDVADSIEQRVWSYLGRLDETAWQAEAVPAIAALRALPEPDRARHTAQRHQISVFEASAGPAS